MAIRANDANKAPAAETARPPGAVIEVFLAFLKLGVTSFGGPIAHLSYFRRELVERRGWIGEGAYADLLALCQFLPGPTSSQVGFSLGLIRAGPLGAIAAWTAFTLPSALLLLLFARLQPNLTSPVAASAIAGLKIVAVAVVAQAVFGMARTLCPDRTRATIAVAAAVVAVFFAGSVGQVAAILGGGLLGLWLCRGAIGEETATLAVPLGKRTGIALLLLALAVLIAASALAASGSIAGKLFNAFYRSGALVFGGGHVVLPLLQSAVVPPGWISQGEFLAGYGAAQAVPGPLFTFAAYLGAMIGPSQGGIAAAVLCLVAIFLPGLLLVTGALPFWDAFRANRHAQAALQGTNAAVVGVLGAALYDPVWIGGIVDARDFVLALVGFVLLASWKAPPLLVLVLLVLGRIGFSL